MTIHIAEIKRSLHHSTTKLIDRYDEDMLSKDMDREKKKMHFPISITLNDTYGTQTTFASAVALAQSEVQSAQNRVLDIHGDAKGEHIADNTFDSVNLWSTWMQRLAKRQPLPYAPELKECSIDEVFVHPTLHPFIPLFASNGFTLAENGFITFQGDSVANPGWINGYVKPLHYLWLEHNKEGVLESCIVLDEAEASRKISQADVHAEHCGTLWLVNQGVVFSQQGKTTEKLYQDDTFALFELRSKILNGDFRLSTRQQQIFNKWITPANRDLLIQFIQTILFPLHPCLANSPEYQQFVKS